MPGGRSGAQSLKPGRFARRALAGRQAAVVAEIGEEVGADVVKRSPKGQPGCLNKRSPKGVNKQNPPLV